MKSWFEVLVGTTRGQLLALLRRSERSVGDLASALRISGNAVRGHLAALQRDGFVESAGVERQTGGKPAGLYGLTPEAEELFPKAYAYVLGALVALLEEQLEGGELERMLAEVGRRAAVEWRAGPAGGRLLPARDDAREGADRAAEALRDLGGEVDVEAIEDGWRLVGHGCPLSAAVGEHEAVCAVARAIVHELSGREVRECCDRGARPRCRFEVVAASA